MRFENLFEQSLPKGGVQAWMGKTFLFLDIGGGNCSATKLHFDDKTLKAIYQYDSKSKPRLISLNGTSHKKIYSLLSYGDNVVYLGERARYSSAPVISNFKITPTTANLMTKVEGFEYSHEKVMTDFIRAFFSDICLARGNEDIKAAWESDDLIIVAAHPSSKDWPTDKFRQLIRNATGLSIERILTIKESRAAIQYAKSVAHVDMKKGVLIYDLGAYSIDATYVCISKDDKKTWDASLALGGHRVELNLLNILMNERHLSEDQFGDQYYDISHVIGALRFAKEDFYRGKRVSSIPIAEDKKHVADFVVTDKHISDAVTQYRFENERPENFPQESSWVEHEASFIEYTQRKLADKPIDTVLVMGGAGNMTEAFDLIEQKHGGKVCRLEAQDVNNEDEVSMNEAVPIGSALHFAQSVRVIREIPELELKLKNFVKNVLVPIIAQQSAAELRDFVWDKIILEAVSEWKSSSTDESFNQLESRVKSKMNTKKNEIPGKLAQSIRSACNSKDSISELNKVIGDFYAQIYNDKWRKELNLERITLENSASGIVSSELLGQLENILSSEDLVNMISSGTFLDALLGVAILVLVALAGYLLWPFWVFVAILSTAFDMAESAYEGIKKFFMDENERKAYEAEKKRQAEQNAKKEAERKEQERLEKLEEEKAKPREKKERDDIYDKLYNPEKYSDDRITITKSDGTTEEVTIKGKIDESKKEIYDSINNMVVNTLQGQLESKNYFGIPDMLIQAITEEIEAAVYVG